MKREGLYVCVRYEAIKDHLFIHVTPYNGKKLKDIPHKIVGDLLLTYRVCVDPIGLAFVEITNRMLKDFDITPEQLHEDAAHATEAQFPAIIETPEEAASRMVRGGEPQEMRKKRSFSKQLNLTVGTERVEPELYVLTTVISTFGAGVVFYPGLLQKVGEELGRSFYVMMLTPHEVIVVPESPDIDPGFIQNALHKEDSTEDFEWLSQTVYRYDRETGTFGPCSK